LRSLPPLKLALRLLPEPLPRLQRRPPGRKKPNN
jgi:hypothetical protein